MPNKLSAITSNLLIRAFSEIDKSGIPKDNEYNNYWLSYRGRLYPFKYSVELASSYLSASERLLTTDFQSNEGYRKTIAKLGFPIQYRDWNYRESEPNFFVVGSFYGREPHLIPMFDQFMEGGYWKTDHDLTIGEGFRVFKTLKRIKINDRIAIRSYSRKTGTVEIAAIGTVTDISEITNGKLSVRWDYNPRKYKGAVPSGSGSGNWWLTITEIKRAEDLELVFDYLKTFKRVARLIWNDNGYIYPSGIVGKSNDQGTHEGKFGFGHEEWLFDTSKLIDGYHYGFIEPIAKQQLTHQGKIYDVWFYTLDGAAKVRFWVGGIDELEVIDSVEAEGIKAEYTTRGWLNEMDEQVKIAEANSKGFIKQDAINIFNVKFKPEKLFIHDPYFEIPEGHALNNVDRYTFLSMQDKYKSSVSDTSNAFGFEQPVIGEGEVPKQPKKKRTVRPPRAVEITYIHRAISDNMVVKLREIYGNYNVKPEHSAGYGQNRVDIIVKDTDGLIFYEIKSYNSIQTCIREAVGQLLEYCLWPKERKAKKMVIVSQISANRNVREYFTHLREVTGLPLYYQSFSLKDNSLSVEC
ncbi:hypothetical protein IDJ77_16365 [Mucilaginibacter sp. ZT4R22]|uniref:Uncharacterized protein n=1 Tax=Mucilaginibacter pankratovii TaxID=2772110 RepID=A0ABR7WVF3_9SPHI|nr:hypothetical protein [Mucilaginibacter pankratovii]MBD1365389.1 hypothetical protein [Mucilaginibacter pankratovii]